jgi:hypothetical protein
MMRFHRLRRLAWATGVFLSLTSMATAASVTFDIRFSAELDCQSPLVLDDIPLAFESTATLKGDGMGIGRLKMTAYHLISFRSAYGVKLGAPPAAIPETPGGTLQLAVLDRTGLSLKIGLPNNVVTVTTRVSENGKNCTSELVSKLRPGKTQHSIYAGNTYFYCDTFTVQNSRCKVT